MDRKKLIELIKQLRDEIGRRQSRSFTQLFPKEAIKDLSQLLQRLIAQPPTISDQMIGKVASDVLLPILKVAGSYPRTIVHDDIGSLMTLWKAADGINKLANYNGGFGEPEVAYLTSKLKGGLERDINIVQQHRDNKY